MDDRALLRYSRHLLLDDIDIAGQQRLLASHALVIGAGGLGSPALLYLAAAGVGRITVVDHDTVDLTNLQRQIAHTEATVGQPKAASAQQAMRALNADVQVQAVAERATPERLAQWVPTADVVLDCSDNHATRQAVNAACVQHGRPLVSGAAVRFDAQLSTWDTREAAHPCYACLFGPDEPVADEACATLGIFAPLVGIVGAAQAAEALKVLVGLPSLAGRLLMLDARRMAWSELRVARNPGCSVCAARS